MRRRIRIRGIAALVLTALICVFLARLILRSEGPQPAEVEPAGAVDVADQSLLCLHRGSLDRGESLFDELVASGVSPRETDRLVRALAEVLDLRRLRPGENYEVLTDEMGHIASFTYVRGVRERINAAVADGELQCEVISVPLEERLRTIEGTVESSLWESMVGQGASPELVIKLADVFAWEIDFLTDPRDGDEYELVAQEFCLGDSVVEYGDIVAARYRGRSRSWTAVGFVGDDGRREYYAPDGKSVKRAFLKSPLNFRRISSYFTHRRFHPILKRYRPHLGLDYAASRGTPVVSIGGGVVVKAGWNGGFGNYVEVRHNSVYSTCYGHLSKYGRGVRKGVRVRQNQVVGYVGSTGLSTGPHLDFRVKKHGSYVNPLKLESPRAEPVPKSEMARFEIEAQWAIWALDYLPAGYAGDAYALRTAMIADNDGRDSVRDLQ